MCNPQKCTHCGVWCAGEIMKKHISTFHGKTEYSIQKNTDEKLISVETSYKNAKYVVIKPLPRIISKRKYGQNVYPSLSFQGSKTNTDANENQSLRNKNDESVFQTTVLSDNAIHVSKNDMNDFDEYNHNLKMPKVQNYISKIPLSTKLQNFACKFCSSTFKSKVNLGKHISLKHQPILLPNKSKLDILTMAMTSLASDINVDSKSFKIDPKGTIN